MINFCSFSDVCIKMLLLGVLFYYAARHSMSADLYFTRLSSSFFRQLISELAERNSTIFGRIVGSKCNLKMHVRNLGYLLLHCWADFKT